jgi:hypothetical protein
MKIRRNSSVFDQPGRRSMRIPVVPIALVVLLVLLVGFLWSRGGEKPQVRVEKAIPAERLGK